MTDAGSQENPQENPEAKAIYKEGFGHFVKGELDEAVDRYRAAIAVDETLSIAWNGLSIALAKQGKMEEAVSAAEKLVELAPDDALSHTNLSRILMQKGDIQAAEDAKAQAMGVQMRQAKS